MKTCLEHVKKLTMACDYRKFSVICEIFLIITNFMGSGWPMFSENTWVLYQQDLKLGPNS